MAQEVLIPPLGQTVDMVTLVEWFKQEGAAVQQGEPLFSIQTDKAILDIEAQASGVLLGVTAWAGDEVKVLTTIALIAAPDEDVAALTLPETPAVEPSSPRVTHQLVVSRQRAAVGARLFISPRARRLAGVERVRLEALTATGPEGAIVERDVRAHLDARASVALPRAPVRPRELVLAETPLQGTRAIIAERTAISSSTIASVTLTTVADASALVNLRQRLARGDLDVSYNALLVHVLSRALREHPALNATLEGQVIRQWGQVHIGLAVDTDRGLVVPVVRDADQKSLGQLACDTLDLAERARTGRLKPEELQGGTFTLTNLGTFGIDAFTPIIALPQTAILGVGRLKARPVVRGEAIVVRQTVWLSLTFDHRLVDGAPAARFLQRLVEVIEHPELMLA